jgi:hypothetical protein
MNNVDYELFNKRLEEIERSLKVLQAYVDRSLKEKYYGNSGAIGVTFTEVRPHPCVFDGMSKEDRMKPMCISCPCPECSPYALSSGSLVDAGLKQQWQDVANRQFGLVDCISTTKAEAGE